AGVKAVICYLCNQTMAGDPDKRIGFWDFYDHWNDYPKLDIGPKPERDPIDWLQRWPDGQMHFTYPKDMPVFKPGFRFQPCQNSPDWRKFLVACTRRIAAIGYDGLFVDNCILHCYCEHCQQRFDRHLCSHYPREQWPQLFGTSFRQTGGKARLYDPGRGDAERGYDYEKYIGEPGSEEFSHQDVLLWVETQRFWADSIVEQVTEMKKAGSEVLGRPFLIVMNWGPFYRVSALNSRRQDAKDVAQFNRVADGIMFEDELDMGRIADALYLDHRLQYKYSLSLGACPVELPSVQGIPNLYELALAEACAGGGGAFCRYSPEFPEVRNKYSSFVRSHPELYDNLVSANSVGICLFFDQLFFENTEHLNEVFEISRCFDEQGILYDYIPESACNLETLRRWKAIVVPNITHLSDDQRAALDRYTREGGNLFVIGYCGQYSGKGAPHLPAEGILPNRTLAEMLECEIGDPNAYFTIELPDGTKGYTRDAHFYLDKDGNVLATGGYPVQPSLVFPNDTAFIDIDRRGNLVAYQDCPMGMRTQMGKSEIARGIMWNRIGQFNLVRFRNPSELKPYGDNVFLQTEKSGQPEEIDSEKARIVQKHKEWEDVLVETAKYLAAGEQIQERFGDGWLEAFVDIPSFLSDARCSLDALKQYYFSTHSLWDEGGKARGQEFMAYADRAFRVDRYSWSTESVTRGLDECSSEPVRVFPGRPIPGLRVNVYLSKDSNRVILHLVNYNVPIVGEEHEFEPLQNVPLFLPVPSGRKIKAIRCL
ncbi:MAG TPA: hypothetical protein PLZ55_12020, partial [bacterium]|nr:hypothetical protein [bacterium]